jgi:hypothetical protein
MNALRLWSLALVMVVAEPARADEEDEAEAPASARAAADSGAFSPWTLSPRSDTQRALVFLMGGYDAARGGPTFDSVAEARLVDRLAVRLGASYTGPDGTMRPRFAAKLDALRQETHGVDLAIVGGYEPNGFNNVAALAFTAAVGRRFGDVTLVGNLGFGAGLEDDERYGAASVLASVRVAPALRLGLDSRLRLDLEHGHDPQGEAAWELTSGPLATFTLGHFALTGGVGLSAVRFHTEDRSHVGALGQLGVGSVF